MENITESIMEIMEKNNSKSIARKIVAALFGVGFLVCVIWLVKYWMQINDAQDDIEDMRVSYVSDLETASTPETLQTENSDATEQNAYPTLEAYDVPAKDIDFAALKQEKNEHIYAWITVPGTVIDYPIVQHPEEPDYYLDYNLDGTKGYPGGIYTQLYNSKDWEDPHTVIYGHNMKNGTMFAGLHQYEDSEFFKENPYVYIYTEEKTMVYEIFAAYEYSDINLITTIGMPGVMTYEEYLESIFTLDGMNNNFNTDITVTTEDKMITLETCIATKPDMRYVVQAVKVAEGKAENR